MEGGREEREVEVEMVGREHPFVVLWMVLAGGVQSGWEVLLTMEMDSEKKYHVPIKITLMISVLITYRSAAFFSSVVTGGFPPPPIRTSSWLCSFLDLWCFLLSVPVKPVSSSASDPVSDAMSSISSSSLADMEVSESSSASVVA